MREVILFVSYKSLVVFAKVKVEPTEKARPIPINPFIQLSTGKLTIPKVVIEIDKIKERHGDRKKRRGTAVFEIAKREHVKVFVSCQKLIPVNILILGL